jgi:hypothetical protein
VFSSAIGRASSWLSAREALSLLLPSLAFWTAVAVLVARAVGLTEVRSWWAGADGLARAVAGAAAAGVVLSFALVMQQLLTPLTRLYEGYWGGTGMGRALMELGRARQERRWDRLDEIIQEGPDRDRASRAYRLRHQRFPRERSAVMPTRIGNVFQAAESYPSDAHLYGMDAVFFWPRLYPLLPDSLRAELAAARSAIDMMLVTSVLSVALGLGIAGGGAAARLPVLGQVLIVAGLLAVSRVSYLGAVNAAVVYAELVRASFDLYRRALLSALGLALPASLAEERRLWRAAGQTLYRRGADEDLEALLRFTDRL